MNEQYFEKAVAALTIKTNELIAAITEKLKDLKPLKKEIKGFHERAIQLFEYVDNIDDDKFKYVEGLLDIAENLNEMICLMDSYGLNESKRILKKITKNEKANKRKKSPPKCAKR